MTRILAILKRWHWNGHIYDCFNWHKKKRRWFLDLPNNDCLHQVKDYVGGCTWQLKQVKTIYMFHTLVFERWDNSLECFNRATHNYAFWMMDRFKKFGFAKSYYQPHTPNKLFMIRRCCKENCFWWYFPDDSSSQIITQENILIKYIFCHN